MSRRTVALGFVVLVGLALIVGVYLKVTAPTVLEIRPREVTQAELKYALSEIPAEVREGLAGSDSEVAKQLGLLVWAFDFKGDPFGCWIDFEETGQQSAHSPYPRDPRNPDDMLHCAGGEGTILFWFQPRITQQMPQVLKDRFLGNKPQVPNLFIAVDMNGKKAIRIEQFGKPDTPLVPLWFGWTAADVKEQSGPVTVKPGASAKILLIEATEKEADNPRRVKLLFTVQN